MNKFIVGLAYMLCLNSVYAQDYDNTENGRKDEPVPEKIVIPDFKFSIRGGFKLPNAIANNSFKKVFNGVSNFEVGVVFPFFKYAFAGCGIQQSFYDINRFSFPEVSNGNLQSYLGFGEIGFQKYLNDKWYFMISGRGGYSKVLVHSANCDKVGEVPNTMAFFQEILSGIYLMGNERMSYGFLISHQMYYFDFGPSWLCKTSFSGLTEQDYAGKSQSFTVGFGFSCIIGEIE